MIWIFNQAGYEVIVPEQFVCCGLPLVSNGFMKDAAKNAASNVSVIKEYQEKGIPIVTGCPLVAGLCIPKFFIQVGIYLNTSAKNPPWLNTQSRSLPPFFSVYSHLATILRVEIDTPCGQDISQFLQFAQ